ncbi:MAG TPA: PAS domain S-box protein [Xanthobacteraceae bacterium]|jgi:PAS domain S-box-containing protein
MIVSVADEYGAVSIPCEPAAFPSIEQAALDALPMGLCVCAADGGLIKYNRRAIELWAGVPRLGGAAAQHPAGLYRYEADNIPLPVASTPIAIALRAGERVIGAELYIARADGSRIPVLMSVAPLKSPSGDVQGAVCSFQEVSGRKKAEKALRAREAELQDIINRTPFMLVRCGRDLRYRFMSQAYAEMLGRRREDVLGKHVVEILGEKSFNTVRPYIEAVLRGESVEFEREFECPGSETRFLYTAYRPETDIAGNVDGWLASLHDITERKRTDAILATHAEEQAALFQFTDRLYRAMSPIQIYEAALDAIVHALHCRAACILCSDDDRPVRVVACRGLSESCRRAIESLSPWAGGQGSPDPLCIDNIDAADLPDSFTTLLKREGVRALCFIPLMTDGKLSGRFLACHSAPHPFTSEGIGLALTLARQLGFGLARMSAERSRSKIEEELRQLSEQLEVEVERRTLERDRIWNVSEDLLAVSSFDGYFLSMNPAWTKLLGWSEQELRSMHVNELRHPADVVRSTAGRQQLAQGIPTVRLENRFRHKDGSWRWLQWTMTEDNGLIYLAGRHVTAEKEAAAALERAQRHAAHLQKMEAIGQLTGGIAHDFNNLLMIVSGHAQNLQSRLPNPKDQRALQAIQMAASRGENLTRQLLSFSSALPLNPTVINPVETVQAVSDVLSGSMHVNIKIDFDAASTVWPVCVDKSELELALVNLAVNARDAMPDGGRLSITVANVRLAAGDTPDGLTGDVIALTVADTGCGIPPDLLSRIVEPFFTTKSPGKGTGLGLSQVYGFARRSGGTLQITSEIDRGTKVTIYMPRSNASIIAPSLEDTAEYRARDQRTILVVEDNQDVREVAVSLLQQLGYRTIAAESANAALDVLEAGQPVDLVFTDVVLPGQIDGLALAQNISRRRSRIPVVLTTGYSKAFETDPEFPVLRKPYQISTLGRLIHETLHPLSVTAAR